jgi:hypothetical protein
MEAGRIAPGAWCLVPGAWCRDASSGNDGQIRPAAAGLAGTSSFHRATAGG